MKVERVRTAVYRIDLDVPESDGTLTWTHTTVPVVEVEAAGHTGLGHTYGPPACAAVVRDLLEEVVVGADAMDIPAAWGAMVGAVRNAGRPGVCSHAIAAVDVALWDLKARLLDLPLVTLLGKARDGVAVYGSGGFTSLSDEELRRQLAGWVHERGIPRVKIKVGEAWGSRTQRDAARTALARRVIGADAELFVDANGAYTAKQAVRMARVFADAGVSWFEEPVSSEDLAGLAAIRQRTDMDVAAGEYGYAVDYFQAMASAGAVDCLQADVSRCAGITEWVRVAAVARAHGLEVSGHTAQSLHLHPACAVPNVRHLEYFADHERVERLLFDGVAEPTGGVLHPDCSRPGHGLALKRPDAERWLVAGRAGG